MTLSLSLPDLKQHLSEGNSQSLRELRAYMGLGSSRTKEENRSLFFYHIERQRHLHAGLQPPHGSASVSIEVASDPHTKSDPWKAKHKKLFDVGAANKSGDIKKPLFEKTVEIWIHVRKLAESDNS